MLTVIRASLLVSIGVTLAAALCGCPMDPPTDVPDGGMVDARDTAEVGMDRGLPDDGQPPPRDVPDADSAPDEGARCEFEEGYAYGFEGGNTASTDTAVLSPRREYTLRREYVDPGRPPEQCMTQIPSCGVAGMLNMSSVLQAIGHPDVVRALAAAPGPDLAVYGHDSRPKDGQVFGFRRVADGHGFYVGEPCGGRPGCTEIPAGLGELVGVLFALDQQERARPACAMLR